MDVKVEKLALEALHGISACVCVHSTVHAYLVGETP